MTVIAYKDGILAADTGMWQGDIKASEVETKIFRLPSGSLYAGCGRRAIIHEVREWFSGGERPEKDDEKSFAALVLELDGKVMRVEWDMRIYEMPKNDFYVLGAHEEFLYGALANGATACQAVELAIEFCQFAFGRVAWQRLALKDG